MVPAARYKYVSWVCPQSDSSFCWERQTHKEGETERFLLNPTNKPWNVFHWRQFNFLLQWIQKELTPAVAGCRMLAGSCVAVDAPLLQHEAQRGRRAPSHRLAPTHTFPHPFLSLLCFPIKIFLFMHLLSFFFFKYLWPSTPPCNRTVAGLAQHDRVWQGDLVY